MKLALSQVTELKLSGMISFADARPAMRERLGLALPSLPSFVWLYLDRVYYTPGSKSTTKKNHYICRAEKVCVSVHGQKVIDHSNYN
jgi:hypothetical protein